MTPGHKIYITRKHCRTDSENSAAMIRRCIKATLKEEGVEVPSEVNITITNDAGIHAINLENRGVDRPTDVLSFPMFDFVPGQFRADESCVDPETGRVFLGDVVISYERVKEQAEEYRHSISRELCYLVIHSALHLLGYDHTDEGPKKAQMREKEKIILRTVGISEND